MRSAALFLVCFGVAWAQQLTPEEQQFLDAALGTGGGDPLSGGGDPLPGGGGISAGGGGPGLEDVSVSMITTRERVQHPMCKSFVAFCIKLKPLFELRFLKRTFV